MRMRLVVGSFALVLFASVVACSGGKPAGGDNAATDDPAQTATPGPADGDPAAAAPAQPKQPAPSDAPPPAASDAGATEGGPAADASGGPINPQCQAGSVQESGSNDTPETANPIPPASGSFCGTLDSPTDVDFVTFTLPAGTKSLGFGLAYSALGVEVEGTAGGETFVVGSKPAFKPGQPYVLKVHTSGMTPVSYLLTVDIKQ